ncbi:monoacylglycerol/Diacylglycerol O-acyltransferase [Anolis carolinensis]|uniref:monoacylglycerol/Diacylglycerol O-acyltransferase n=1 Tax=Anolis carolinensis TaxID=28377 RepID=UPI002F2B3B26
MHEMAAMKTPGVPGEEMITWFSSALTNRTDFTYLKEYVIFVINPLWLLVPLILLYSIYSFMYIFGCFGSFIIYVYKKKTNLPEDTYSEPWNKVRQAISQVVSAGGKILHGYEVIGMEHIPEGPGIITFYHGAIVFDYAFLVANIFAEKGRVCHSLVDHTMVKLPGLKLALDAIHCKNYTKAECLEILKKGNLLGLAPGGLREGNFSDQYYNLMWGNRTGFAQLALDAKVPIIPMFTQNLREGYRSTGKTWLSRWLYEHTRFLVLPTYGGFPVKFRTYIGEPIPYDPNITAKELAEKAKTAIEHLRDRYQKRPGNILRALLERFEKHHKDI